MSLIADRDRSARLNLQSLRGCDIRDGRWRCLLSDVSLTGRKMLWHLGTDRFWTSICTLRRGQCYTFSISDNPLTSSSVPSFLRDQWRSGREGIRCSVALSLSLSPSPSAGILLITLAASVSKEFSRAGLAQKDFLKNRENKV